MTRCIAIALLTAFLVSPAEAQPRPTPLQMDRARLGVHEAGWQSPDDHFAIWHSIQRRAAVLDLTEREMIDAYTRGRIRRPHNPRAVWVLGLDFKRQRPPGWPAHLSWERHEPWWLGILGASMAFDRGEIDDPCDGPAEHWGGMRLEADRANARRAIAAGRWVRVDCGETRNDFFAVRRRRGGA